jgi:hypothetical protein
MRRFRQSAVPALVCFLLVIGLSGCPWDNPKSSQNLYCLFNQEATASDSAGIHKYSRDLIERIVHDPGNTNALQISSDRLTNRLANAELTARAGNGKLVPEAAVVKAFNDLMQEIGAPPC